MKKNSIYCGGSTASSGKMTAPACRCFEHLVFKLKHQCEQHLMQLVC